MIAGLQVIAVLVVVAAVIQGRARERRRDEYRAKLRDRRAEVERQARKSL